ncbi:MULTISPECIES: NADP-dependent phosphogluconate dehydrogenase [Streptomyces]|uniref:6-phosphogluconate dehydrogenase, decarboxylating n=1 Tax=Streptomyces tsukubensis (strain DSM 42081 / NBRC 108919 / NRRL 18488 / 9993) TaxID=1114943 RepID=I2NAK9_STRT9|nr:MULTISPECIES: NADP-dependent phosphogluconate dehydrogenase [Streptomyces]AZK97837.1 phosphogluconate dehydrogenase (NADP(+)-dependent, decarboxylating) [Streptomyces tsukubensis]EIF94056.1 6-phosphogluconate dehydrogenase [Streptomyces tsukubensis NRRL18488]MYS68629.1 NADP-dependent phosphogluconate dehydrogenase [Streptomyces sp. SID5473]QKM66235.1 phosphogluconate dehydrogenase (NADP(+)-dependent, decarboxylating) [Streptomyces tsukubensis NRRL18488]TAI45427.1 NADP-dependent phosphogluco
MSGTAQIGVTGLAVMGRNLARNFARNGFTVAVHNRTAAKTRALVEEFGDEGSFVPAESPEEFVAALERPRRLVIMVKAGEATDAVIQEFVPLLEEGDVIIDGGNAHFADTRRRERELRERGIHFVGTGISGGEEGALHGPSIMPGGSVESYASLGPLLERIAAKAPDGAPTVAHIGPDGAGHFVKMVHNGIEYADMQLIAEAYDLLRSVAGYSPARIAETFREWNRGRLDSYLIGITAEVLAHTDAATGRPFVDVVADRAEQKGTGRWTVQIALDLGVPVSGIAEAVFARSVSGHTALREASRGLPGPVPRPLDEAEADRFAARVEQALYASKIVSYTQGFHQIAAGSEEYGWNVDLGSVAAIWRAGCIIRADFLDRIREAYDTRPGLPSLLSDRQFAEEIGGAQDDWRDVVATAAREGVPTPGFSASLAYYDALRAERLPAALTQGQRDFFGAHTYRRTDRPGAFHTLWGGDRSEVAAD